MTIVRILLLCLVTLLLPSSGALAQTAYPTQTVKIVVPFTAGSNTDILARSLADKLGALWRQNVIVENRPGIPGTVSVANSAPDGYTLMLTSNGHTILNVINKDLPVDPVKSFAGITPVATVPLVLIVTPSVEAKSLKEFVALAKAKPNTLNFSSAGIASSNYIAGELFKQTAAIDILHIPYRGTPEQLTSVIRGDSQMSLAFVGTAISFIKSGQVRPVAMATSQRYPALPDVPTFAESGMPQYQYNAWFGLLAPAKTPAGILKKVSEDVAMVMKNDDVIKRLDAMSAIPMVSTPEQFDETVRSDAERYGKLLRAAGVAGN